MIRKALGFLQRTAVVTDEGSFRYGGILRASLRVCDSLGAPPAAPPATRQQQPRLAVLCEPGAEYVAATWAAWLRRGIAVPLSPSHPDRELEYVLRDCGAAAVLATGRHAARAASVAGPLGVAVQPVPALPAGSGGDEDGGSDAAAELAAAVEQRLQGSSRDGDGALLVYTSGTTGPPKGALHTHGSVCAQVETLAAAWEWQPADRILHCLPLHHVHGVVNALYVPLFAGAAVEMLPRFSPAEVWRRLRRGRDAVTVFMGVPTMYHALLEHAGAAPAAERAAAAAAARRLRLVVSGSAALPAPLAERWRALAGAAPLERYGMTETGMLLGVPLHGERRPGAVGLPFAGVEARVVAEGGRAAAPGEPGELRVRSRQLFAQYWNRPEATAAAFDGDGWFCTGDTAVRDAAPPHYFSLLGRTSVDILKHKGYKISAPRVEAALLEHAAVAEAAVVGLPDEAAGQVVAAVLALRPGARLAAPELRRWAAERLPPYEVPSELRLVPALPRNAMGKVNKRALAREVWPDRRG